MEKRERQRAREKNKKREGNFIWSFEVGSSLVGSGSGSGRVLVWFGAGVGHRGRRPVCSTCMYLLSSYALCMHHTCMACISTYIRNVWIIKNLHLIDLLHSGLFISVLDNLLIRTPDCSLMSDVHGQLGPSPLFFLRRIFERSVVLSEVS